MSFSLSALRLSIVELRWWECWREMDRMASVMEWTVAFEPVGVLGCELVLLCLLLCLCGEE